MKNFLKYLFLFLVIGCNKKPEKSEILSADREAPLGWIYLKMYDDNSFDFIYKSMRNEKIHSGTFEVKNDTIFFSYKDSIPVAGSKAVIENDYVNYINGKYSEQVQIKLNKLKNK